MREESVRKIHVMSVLEIEEGIAIYVVEIEEGITIQLQSTPIYICKLKVSLLRIRTTTYSYRHN